MEALPIGLAKFIMGMEDMTGATLKNMNTLVANQSLITHLTLQIQKVTFGKT